MSERYQHLLDRRALVGPRVFGMIASLGATGAMAETLNDRAAAVAAMQVEELPAGVIIGGRDLPDKHGKMRGSENDRINRIIATAKNVRAQAYGGTLVIAATVDAGNFDPSAKQRAALDEYDVRPLRLNADINHSMAINLAAHHLPIKDGVGLALPAGNRLATDQALRAASMYVSDGARGVFGPRVMDKGGSKLAQRLLNGDSEYTMQYAEPDNHPTADETGFMSDAGSAFNLATLRGYPLSEEFGQGGGLRDWGDDMQEGAGHIWYDPALAVHDSSARTMNSWSLLDEVMREEPTDYPG